MLPLIPLALWIAPQLLKWVAGDRGAAVCKDVASVIQTVTGIDPTTQQGAEDARALIADKPGLQSQLHQRLVEIAAAREAEANREADACRQSQLEELKTQVADLSNARQQTITLPAHHNPMALGAPILSGIILVAFTGMLGLILIKGFPSGDTTLPLANIMLGTLAAMSTQVANYWLGSSQGSAAKTTLLANAQNKLWLSTPPKSVEAGPTQGSAAAAVKSTSLLDTMSQPLTSSELNQRSLEAARAGR